MRRLFLPEPMALGQVVVLDDHIPHFMEAILDSGVVQVEDSYQVCPVDLDAKYDFKQELAKIDLLESRVEAICRILEVDLNELKQGELYTFIDEVSVVPGAISDRISSDLDRIEANISEVVSLIEERKQFIFEQNQISWFLSILMHSGLEYMYELNMDLLSYWVGSIPRNNLPLLKEGLSEIPTVLEWALASRDRMMIFLASTPEYKERISAALKAGNFLSVDLNILSRTTHISELIDDIEFSIWEAREDIGELSALLDKKKHLFQELLAKIIKLLSLEKKLVQAMSMCQGTKFVGLVNIWVREKDKENVSRLLNEKLNSIIAVKWLKSSDLNLEKNKVPASFNIGGVWRVFFDLMRMYGYPSYAEVNPIVFFTIGSILMYGMMFADIAHGLILALSAFWIRKFSREFGVMMFCAGLSSSVWGGVFGTVFGREDLIPALWVSPMQAPIKVMALSIGIGVVYLSLGIILSVVNRSLNGNIKEAIFGMWGGTSLLFYFLLILAIVADFSTWTKVLLIGLGLVIFIWGLSRTTHEIDELISSPVEMVLSLFSNTISFVRLAAFAINHAALMIVVFVIADLVKGAHLNGVSLVLGNIFVMGLEAVLVAIQTLRLQFYEFFSKFYQGTGREFNPLRWEIV